MAFEWVALAVRDASGIDNAQRLARVRALANLARALGAIQPLLADLSSPAFVQLLGGGWPLQEELTRQSAALEELRRLAESLEREASGLEQQRDQVAERERALATSEEQYRQQLTALKWRAGEVERREQERRDLLARQSELAHLEELVEVLPELREQVREVERRLPQAEEAARQEDRLAQYSAQLLTVDARLLGRLREQVANTLRELEQKERELLEAERQLRLYQEQYSRADELHQQRLVPLRHYLAADQAIADRLLRPGQGPEEWLRQAEELLGRVDAALSESVQTNEQARQVPELEYTRGAVSPATPPAG